MNNSIVQRILLMIFFFGSSSTIAQPLAFPGAEGFGRYTTGGRDGQVVIVSNLNDSGEGSLRQAIETKGPRIITFAVSGTIALESPLPVDDGDLTIAGQSAPGEGICLKNYSFRVSADNVIIRYMRFRMGDEKKYEGDALNARRHNNIIIDHCSISWSTDECASFYGNKDFTLQWCIISESLNNSVHQKGKHGYGGIWGGTGATFHHNLMAHNTSRNPRFSGSSTTPNSPQELTDFRNNVIYNWQFNTTYGGEKGRYNMVNNYYKAGPATNDKSKFRIVNPYKPYGMFYIQGNCVVGNKTVSNNNWHGGVYCDDPSVAKAETPFGVIGLDSQESAEEAFKSVLKSSGASLHRDDIDKRIIEEVSNGTATFNDGIIDSQKDVGGWPELKTGAAPTDTDHDAMPDTWEKEKGLDSTRGTDAAGHDLDETYTNIEIYLNELIQ